MPSTSRRRRSQKLVYRPREDARVFASKISRVLAVLLLLAVLAAGLVAADLRFERSRHLSAQQDELLVQENEMSGLAGGDSTSVRDTDALAALEADAADQVGE